MHKNGVKKIYLSYFGTADPNAYGIRYSAVAPATLPDFQDEDVDLQTEGRQLLVVSATNFQSTYFADKGLFGWLHQKPVAALVAKSLLVFDITQDAQSHARLADIFRRMGREPMARREEARSLSTDAVGGKK